jgi:hypothetical protein
MADIHVQDLEIHNLSGSELFYDSESFMKEISDETEKIVGGKGYCIPPTCQETHHHCTRGSGVVIVHIAD